MKITQKMPSPTGVAASSSAVCVLPIGLSYEELYLVCAGSMTPVNMNNIRVVANGRPIQEFRTGTELNLYNVYNKRTTFATNSILVIDFTRRLLIDRPYRELTKLGTGLPVDLRQSLGTRADGSSIPNVNYNPFPVQTLTLEMDIAAGMTTGTLAVFAKQSEAAPTGLIRKIRKFSHNPNATPFDIADYPKGDMINAIYFNTGVKLTNLKVLRENYTIFDRSATLNNLIQTDETLRTPQAALQVIDTTESGYGDQVITTAGVNDFRITCSFSTTPTTLTSTVDFIGQLDR